MTVVNGSGIIDHRTFPDDIMSPDPGTSPDEVKELSGFLTQFIMSVPNYEEISETETVRWRIPVLG